MKDKVNPILKDLLKHSKENIVIIEDDSMKDKFSQLEAELIETIIKLTDIRKKVSKALRECILNELE